MSQHDHDTHTPDPERPMTPEDIALLIGGVSTSGIHDFDPNLLLGKPREIEVYSNPSVKKQIAALINTCELELTEKSLTLYPGSAADASFADVVEGKVIHIDPDGDSMNALAQKHYHTETSTIEDFTQERTDLVGKVDMIVSYNAGTLSDDTLALIRPGGYVIANNWHESANSMGERAYFELVGSVDEQSLKAQDAKVARQRLGTQQMAILPGGDIVVDSEEIAKLEPDSYTLLEEPIYTEDLWLFQKKTD